MGVRAGNGVGRRPCLARWLQIGVGALTGTVADQAGRPAPGATVTATAVTTRALRLAVTDANGRYTVPGLASGPYDLRVELSGFRPLTRDGIGSPPARPCGSTCSSPSAR